MTRRASAALKASTPVRDAWRNALSSAEAREFREHNLPELADVRAWLADKTKREPRAFWNFETAARLWALALTEEMPDVAEALAANVQSKMLAREYEARFPAPRKDYRPEVSLTDWYAGVGNTYTLDFGSGVATTRVRRKGDHLETSRGAVVPFRSAVRAFAFAQQCRRKGEAWHRNGHQIPIGPYQLDSIDSAGNVKAGCHTLTFDEMEACAVREMIPAELAPTFPLPVPTV